MKKLLSVLAGALMVPAVAFSSVAATGMGQVEGGDIYRVKNTKSGDFADSASAVCGDTVQFKVRIHNPGPSALQNVTVTATLPNVAATSHVSKVTVSSPYADPTSTSDTATVNLDKAGTLAYVAGSTELLDANNAKLSTLGDTVTTSGVNIGNVGVSINEKRYVQFQAKVNCAPEQPKEIQVCRLADKQIVTIKESDYDTSKYSKNLDDCKEIVKNIKVCDLTTKKIVTIDEKNFDSSKYSKDLNKCVETPAPGKLTVCDMTTHQVVTINENEFNADKHSKDLNKCAEVLGTTTPEAPATIASTGPTAAIATMFGLSSLAAGIGYAIQRRRSILG